MINEETLRKMWAYGERIGFPKVHHMDTDGVLYSNGRHRYKMVKWEDILK